MALQNMALVIPQNEQNRLNSILDSINKERILDNIIMETVGPTNISRAENHPHRTIGDIVGIYLMDAGNGYFIHITDSIAEKYEIDENELFEASHRGIEPSVYDLMEVTVSKVIGLDDVSPIKVSELQKGNDSIYIIREYALDQHPSDNVGSSALFDTKFLKNIHERIGDFYIIPSSTDELIIVSKCDGRIPSNALGSIIEDVNSTVVPQDKILSNKLYMFCGEEVEMAEEGVS